MLNINSVWTFIDFENVKNGEYRLLEIYESVDSLIFFQINEKKSNKPIIVDIQEFIAGKSKKTAKESHFDIPPYQQARDCEIKPLHKEKRDIAYSIIEPFITQKAFLYNYATEFKSKDIKKYSVEKNIDLHKIYRSLNLFWKYGQNINALLPAYSNSGGISHIRKDTLNKRGRPHKNKFELLSKYSGKNITDHDRENIFKSFKSYCLKTNPRPITHAYKAMLAENYAKEIERAEIYKEIPPVPSLPQYRYWIKKLINSDEILKKQVGERKYALQRRAILSSAVNNNHYPGTCYEIDATIADTHIVSEHRRNYCIGRPTIYAVTDKASRMIVGIHVSLEHASWKAARQALVNSFTSKVDYCMRYGVEITDAQWPCHHLPYSLLCDRGEMISEKAASAVVPYMHLKIAPPYRADFKGIVERRFGIFNEELLHHLDGTTKGKYQIRGEIDPRINAVYTLNQITNLIIQEVLTHNSRIYKSLAKETTMLIKHDLSPTPLNYWNIHTHENMHQLKSHDEADIRAKLLPKYTAYITSKGIEVNSLFYTNPKLEEAGVFSTARSKGRIKINARINYDDTNEIFIQLTPHDSFIKCTLTSRSDAFQNLHLEDVLYFNEWLKEKEKTKITSSEEINRHKIKKEIKNEAHRIQSEAKPLNSKNEKIIDIRDRRKQEENYNKIKNAIEESFSSDIETSNKPSVLDEKRNYSSALDAIKSNRNRNTQDES